jgi:hypothetical protein
VAEPSVDFGGLLEQPGQGLRREGEADDLVHVLQTHPGFGPAGAEQPGPLGQRRLPG